MAEAKCTVIKDGLLGKDDFLIANTRCGASLRWKHNNRAIRVFLGCDARKRATRFRNWLIDWGNAHPEVSIFVAGKLVKKEG